jgi:mannose-6-phosphate isomerase-like protein (cupin superfamily)
MTAAGGRLAALPVAPTPADSRLAGSRKRQRRSEMASPHSRINLADVSDAALADGLGERWEARVARLDLHAEQTGLTHFRLHPSKRSPFMHRHRRAEEIYVILRGTGRIKLDEEILDVRALDAVRVAPEVARAFEAGLEGLEFIAFGPHYDADGEPIVDTWIDE